MSGSKVIGTVANATTAGNATTADTATGFSGSLGGDVTGTQNATVVSKVGGQTESRSLVLRDVTESAAFRAANYNAAFVLTEYCGYLRRNPDPEGYSFWLNVLTNLGGSDPGNYRGMVCWFITSTEYQKRFSSIVTHGNSECGH